MLCKVQIGSEVMVIEIYKKIQFHFNLCINCTQTFKLIRINCVSIIIYCSLFTFFCFIFRYFKVWKCHFFRQGFLFCFTYMTLFLWQGHSLKICMTTSQLMRVINDVRIINIDNWIVEINRISAVKNRRQKSN